MLNQILMTFLAIAMAAFMFGLAAMEYAALIQMLTD